MCKTRTRAERVAGRSPAPVVCGYCGMSTVGILLSGGELAGTLCDGCRAEAESLEYAAAGDLVEHEQVGGAL